MMKLLIAIMAIASTASAQVDFDTAWQKLKAKEAAHAATTAPADPGKPSLVKTLDILIRQADGIVDVYTDGLTSAQKQDQDQRTAEKVATLIGQVEGNRMTVKVVVTDVLSREGEYLAVGEVPIPSPGDIERERADMIRAANQIHDDAIRQARERANGKGDSEGMVRRATQEANATLQKHLAQIRDKFQPLKATVHLLGDRDLLKWGKGETRTLEVVTVDRITLDTEVLKGQATRDVTYVNHADVYAAVGPVRRTTSWKAFADKGGMFGSHGLESNAAVPVKSSTSSDANPPVARKDTSGSKR